MLRLAALLLLLAFSAGCVANASVVVRRDLPGGSIAGQLNLGGSP